MALILVICQKIGQMGLIIAMLTKSAFFGGGGPMPGTVPTSRGRGVNLPDCLGKGALQATWRSNNCNHPDML